MVGVVAVAAVVADAFGDACGEFAFCFVGVARACPGPVVDDEGGVVVGDAELVEGFGESVRTLVVADLPERGGVGAGFGEEVAAEPEHVRPAPQLQVFVVRVAFGVAEVPAGLDHAAVVVGDPQVVEVELGADWAVGGFAFAGALGGVFRDVAGRRRRCRCGESHHDADTRIGAPLDPDAYDYVGAVLWQANSGVLWSRFVENVRRSLAAVVGMSVRAVKEQVRVSYGKVSEFQRRGLIHFHAVVRLDGPEGPQDAPPAWATPDVLDAALRRAHAVTGLTTCRPDGVVLDLAWGRQFDTRRIDQRTAAEVEDDDGRISETRLAGEVQPTLSVAAAIARALNLSLDELAGETGPRRVDLAGDWWASWQTSKDDEEVITAQEVRMTQRADLIEVKTTTRGIEVEDGGYHWSGELRLWDNEILMGWYVAAEGGVRSKGTMYFVLHPHGVNLRGRWVGLRAPNALMSEVGASR